MSSQMEYRKSAYIFTILVCVFLVPFYLFLTYYRHSSLLPSPYYQEFGALVALPLLFITGILAYRGSLRAHLIQIGILFYIFHVCAIQLSYPCRPQYFGFVELGLEREYVKMFLADHPRTALEYFRFVVFEFGLPGFLYYFLVIGALAFSVLSIDMKKISEDTFGEVPRKSTAKFLIFGVVAFCLPLIIIFFKRISFDEGLVNYSYFITHDRMIIAMHFGRLLPYFCYAVPEIRLGIIMPLMGIAAYLLWKKRTIGHVMAPILLVKGALPIITFFNLTTYTIVIKYSLFGMIRTIFGFFEIGNSEVVSFDKFMRYFRYYFQIDVRIILFYLFTVGCVVFSVWYLTKMKGTKNVPTNTKPVL